MFFKKCYLVKYTNIPMNQQSLYTLDRNKSMMGNYNKVETTVSIIIS